MGANGADKSLYLKANYVTTFDFPSGCSVYYPLVQNSGQTGFQNRKMCSERKDYKDTDEGYNYPVLRLAEVYLIYAEAKCELGDGRISDSDLDKFNQSFYMIVVVRLVSVMLLLHKRMLITKQIQVSLEI